MSNKVSFLFTANDKFSKVTKSIGRGVDKLNKKFGGLNRRLKRTDKKFKETEDVFSKGFKRMGAAALAFISIRGLAGAIGVGADFQDAMLELSAITGAAGDDLDSLKDTILNLSKESKTKAKEVAIAFKLVASAKPELLENLDALAETTKQVLLLKNAAKLELEPAANITAQGLNIFGKGAEFAGKFVNILAAGSKLGGSEIAQTGEAMLIAGPAAKAAGLNFLSLNAALQTVAIGGIKGSQAGTALNSIFGRLRRTGFDFEKQGLAGVFEQVGTMLNRVTDSTARAKLEAKLFGEEHSKVGLALVDNFKHLSTFERVLKDTNVAQEQADINLASFNAKMRGLGITIQAALIRTFLKLEPILSKNIDKMVKFLDSITTEQIEAFANSLAALVSVAVELLSIGGQAFSIFSAIATLPLTASRKLNELVGIGGAKSAPERGGRSQSDVNIGITAPQGVVQSIKQKTTGGGTRLKVGQNMAPAQ